MNRQQELALALRQQLTDEQMVMVWELASLNALGSTSIEEAIYASEWECPDCGWPLVRSTRQGDEE